MPISTRLPKVVGPKVWPALPQESQPHPYTSWTRAMLGVCSDIKQNRTVLIKITSNLQVEADSTYMYCNKQNSGNTCTILANACV